MRLAAGRQDRGFLREPCSLAVEADAWVESDPTRVTED